jgi:hypothetical protein
MVSLSQRPRPGRWPVCGGKVRTDMEGNLAADSQSWDRTPTFATVEGSPTRCRDSGKSVALSCMRIQWCHTDPVSSVATICLTLIDRPQTGPGARHRSSMRACRARCARARCAGAPWVGVAERRERLRIELSMAPGSMGPDKPSRHGDLPRIHSSDCKNGKRIIELDIIRSIGSDERLTPSRRSKVG